MAHIGPFRSVWTPEPKMERLKYRIFDVCDVLHSHCIGTSDPLHRDLVDHYVAFLTYRLANWHQAPGRWNGYDGAVKSMIEAVLEEVRNG